MKRQIEPFMLPPELYAEIMALPDGADLTGYFDVEDPAWVITGITLVKELDGGMSFACTGLLKAESECIASNTGDCLALAHSDKPCDTDASQCVHGGLPDKATPCHTP